MSISTKNRHKIKITEEDNEDINEVDFLIITENSVINDNVSNTEYNIEDDTEDNTEYNIEDDTEDNTEDDTEDEIIEDYSIDNYIEDCKHHNFEYEIINYEIIFIFKDKVYVYKIDSKVYKNVKTSIYVTETNAGIEAFTKFIKDAKIDGSIETIFLIKKGLPMTEKTELVPMVGKKIVFNSQTIYEDDEICIKDIINVTPLKLLMNNYSYTINNMLIINDCKLFLIKNNINELCVIQDKDNFNTSKVAELFDNLPNTIENLYIFCSITKSINNLPPNIKKIFLLGKNDEQLIKIPFGCEIVKVNI